MMKKILSIAMALTLGVGAFAQEKPVVPAASDNAGEQKKKGAFVQHVENHFKFYGFVRNYFAFDSRECTAGSGDLYFWFPKDENINEQGEDLTANPSFRFLSLTSRVGVDVMGYEYAGYKFGAKIEADFYAGLNGSTGTAQLRLRQAYATVEKNWRKWKIGQAWHPMAADLPDIFSLESGAPFGAFSRTPQLTFDAKLGKGFSLTASALWQMQYCSPGPGGASADFIKFSCTPEFYLGVNWANKNTLLRLGADVLSIKPYTVRNDRKVDDRVTTVNVFQYGQFKMGEFTLKEKVIYGNDASHMNLIGGYGATEFAKDGVSYNYAATNNISSWATLQWKRKDCRWVPSLFVGYIYNFGTSKPVLADQCWFKNSATTISQMWRIQPEILYNLGKFQIGLEYMCSPVQYGKEDKVWMHPTKNLHWVTNHRVQAMVKFNF